MKDALAEAKKFKRYYIYYPYYWLKNRIKVIIYNMSFITPPIKPKLFTVPLVVLVFSCIILFALFMALFFAYFIEGIKYAL